jgi:diguanylate cyclase (GGDEF)-like protein
MQMKSSRREFSTIFANFRSNLVLWLGAAVLAAILALMGAEVVVSHQDSKDRITTNFAARGESSADFIATFITQQAQREQASAKRFLSGHRGLSAEFARTVVRFGSHAAVLLDKGGRLIAVAPDDPSIIGQRIAPKYPHLRAAERGRVAVSGVVNSAAEGEPVIGIAVPYATPSGRRVFSVAYQVSGTVLASFINHTSLLKGHKVLLVDSSGNVVATSSRSGAPTLAKSFPALAGAVAKAPQGSVTVAGRASTYLVRRVPGTPWRLIVAVPDGELFASIGGATEWLPWVTLALIALLGAIALALLARSRAEHARARKLGAQLALAARTDPLTGLPNRRALDEQVGRTLAYARRHGLHLSALMIDLDNFKQINDNYGHAAGDRALCALASSMQAVLRESDVFGRWGGDEFLAILTGPPEEMIVVAERVRMKIAGLDTSDTGVPHRLTISIGCASGDDLAMGDLIGAADSALLAAKGTGRDRIVLMPRLEGSSGPDDRRGRSVAEAPTPRIDGHLP